MADRLTVQFLITPASGKRVIAKAIAALPEIKEALQKQTVAIIAGTTNAYVADEILKSIGQSEGFSMRRFFRGISLPPGYSLTESGRLKKNEFPGDVIIEKGVWHKGKTIFEIADGLEKGDIIIKGANALDPISGQAGIYIGNKKAGTIIAVMQSVYGRRVSLYLPVGLEKRVFGSLQQIANTLNPPYRCIGPAFVSGERKDHNGTDCNRNIDRGRGDPRGRGGCMRRGGKLQHSRYRHAAAGRERNGFV
jgi:hypothetical protein